MRAFLLPASTIQDPAAAPGVYDSRCAVNKKSHRPVLVAHESIVCLNNQFVLCRYNSGQFEVNVEFPGLSVEYSVDNGQTWSKIPSSSFTANKSTKYLFITRSVNLSYSCLLTERVDGLLLPAG